MLEGVPVFHSAACEFVAVKQVVGNAHIEKVELWCLYEPPLHGLGVGGKLVAYERVLKDVEIVCNGGGTYSAFLGYVFVVDYFAVADGCYFQKALECTEISDKCFFLYFFLLLILFFQL